MQLSNEACTGETPKELSLIDNEVDKLLTNVDELEKRLERIIDPVMEGEPKGNCGLYGDLEKANKALESMIKRLLL